MQLQPVDARDTPTVRVAGRIRAFSVSPSQIERVKRYIAHQAEHHRSRSFEDEFLAMLQAANIQFERDQIFG